jgi:hypothetical protein
LPASGSQAEVIVVAVRWYRRFGLSDRDVDELLAERGIAVDHVTGYRWVQRFTRCWPTRPDSPGTRRTIAGSWTRPTSRSTASGVTSTGAIDQHGQVIDVLLTTRRDAAAALRFFTRALRTLKSDPAGGGHGRCTGLSGRARRSLREPPARGLRGSYIRQTRLNQTPKPDQTSDAVSCPGSSRNVVTAAEVSTMEVPPESPYLPR